MGIKGIYGEIGPGERIALSKLAIEKFEQTHRPLRIAIDISIWQFQIQAGQGGTNPAIRTLYYRLLRLLSVSVQPLFVFDGPHKPKFKRNKRVGQGGAMVPNLLTKQLLKHFGFPFHMAPGEAEAECALLQREGIVDAVLSEDVDTLMFGCGTTLRNWSSEGPRGNKSPTHVSLYDAKATKEGKSALDREGMVLVALMSGGDYITEGIPGCGIKVACEAARAGYGKSLCQIPRSDNDAYAAWRASLVHEIQTNESKHFRIKHKGLKIPEDFPNKEVLGYYTHPVVSSSSKVEKLKDEIVWDGEIDIQGLRVFVADAFEWTNKIGARKFIRGLAPVLLIHKLLLRGDRRASGYGDIVLTSIDEMELVRAICGQRTHFSTDGIPELRVVYHPNDIVGLDLDAEPDDSEDYGRDGLAPVHDDDQIEAYASEDQASRSTSPSKRGPSQYDPTQPDKLWIPHTIAKVGVPLKVEDYEESLRDPKKFLKQKSAAKKAATKGGMPKGSIDRFVKVTKPASSKPPVHQHVPAREPILPPAYLAPLLASTKPIAKPAARTTTRSTRTSTESITSKNKPPTRNTKAKPAPQPILPKANPWTLSQITPTSSSKSNPTITKGPLQQQASPKNIFIDLLSSSPVQARSSPPAPLTQPTFTPRKHVHSPTPPSSRGSDHGKADLDLPPLPSTVKRTRGTKNVEESPLLTPSSGERNDGKPSPRKRRSAGSPSPEEDSSTIEPEDQGLAITTNSTARRSKSPSLSATTHHPPRLAAAVIDLSSSPLPASPTSPPLPKSLSSMPPPPAPPRFSTGASKSHLASTSNTAQPSTNSSITKPKTGKKFLMLRESIGTFQELNEEELEAAGAQRRRLKGRERRAFRYSEVEMLDLTEGK